MTSILSLRTAKRFGLWYLAYEAVSLVAFIAFGARMTGQI
jgi:hypothetical protein